MNKLIILSGICLSMMFTGCENFLDTEDLTKKNTSNFPETLVDAEAQVIGIYASLSEGVGCKENSSFFVSCVASDDAFGGGGNNDKKFHAYDFLMSSGENMFELFWGVRYKGIYRANSLIESIENATFNEQKKNQFKGEAYFLRAYFYHELASLFGEVPMVIKTAPQNMPKASADVIYGQIASDLKNAIELLPADKYSKSESGRVTKWAAEALMARIFLFYTGLYNKSEIALPEGGQITKADVVEWLNNCISESGHSLVDDYRQIWPYTNSATSVFYDQNDPLKGLVWAEDNGVHSPETVLSIKFSNQSTNAGNTLALGYSNQFALFMGIRGGNQDKVGIYPFGQGWGACPVNPQLFNDWKTIEKDDMRLGASLINFPVDMPKYQKGADNNVQETDYCQKKIMPVRSLDRMDDNNNPVFFDSFSMKMFDNKGDYQTANIQDLILIRYADVLLMHSELTETNQGLNMVRARAKRPEIAYSLTALQNERRWEFAFEGIRWNDIRRWGIAAEVLEKQIGQPIYNFGEPAVSKSYGGGYAARYKATKGFFPIPESQIRLSQGVLVQNEGWGPESVYTGWTK
ncbi:MAG: RagB/SusD family nutrient uptake outer membrane protein [Bacteroidales bacterium]